MEEGKKKKKTKTLSMVKNSIKVSVLRVAGGKCVLRKYARWERDAFGWIRSFSHDM